MELIDREPDFYRSRFTRCASCGHEETFDGDWFDRWACGGQVCPGCGVDCTQEAATRVAAEPDDPALDDGALCAFSWWHTSTHADWPSADYDPVAALDGPTRRRMGGRGLERWAQRQRTKALHVGTYEAAIHNMLRRSTGQGDRDKQFYLYRVRLRPDLVVTPGCGEEPVDFMGDVQLVEACRPGFDVTRYVNRHEDPGGISLALGRDAIHSVQSLPIPLAADPGGGGRPAWFGPAVDELAGAPVDSVLVIEPDDRLTRLRRSYDPTPPTTSRRREVQREVRDRVLTDLPASLRDGLSALVPVDDAIAPRAWCERLEGVTRLVTEPHTMIRAVADTEPRSVSTP